MQKLTLLSCSVFILTLFNMTSNFAQHALKVIDKAPQQVAEWSFLTYIAADNNLAEFATVNINDMSKGMVSVAGTNFLVQWDQPNTKKTIRYQVLPGGVIDAGSLATEMGYNPATELVSAAQWMVKNYPAKHYAIVLWNHGSGIRDLSPASTRGILYDDSQGTCLTNQGLVDALVSIKKMIGKNVDLIAMDACLMAMVEVAYQMKETVDIFVASEQTIPGEGFPYSKFVKPLTTNPSQTTAAMLAQHIVNGYQQYYSNEQRTADFTLSAMELTLINPVKENIDQFIAAVKNCAEADAAATKTLIVEARKKSTAFEMPEYIDLYSFYAAILSQRGSTKPKSARVLEYLASLFTSKPTAPSAAYQKALENLDAVIHDGLNKITSAIIHNVAGPTFAGVKGISIYYPKSGSIDSTYLATSFAKDTEWVNFIKAYRP